MTSMSVLTGLLITVTIALVLGMVAVAILSRLMPYVLRAFGRTIEEVTHGMQCRGTETGHCDTPGCRYNRPTK